MSFLDNPTFNWKSIIVGFTVGQFAFEKYLDYRQLQVLKRATPPASLQKEVSQETFAKSQDYSRAKLRFGFVADTFNLLQNLAIVRYDVLPKFWNLSGWLMAKAVPVLPRFMGGVITQSLFFFVALQVASTLVGAPLSYYSNFVLEERYGFNKLTVQLWLTDKLKGLALGAVLGTPVIACFLKIIDYFGDSFIFYTMGFMLVVQLVGMTIFPTLIQPLFNKFTPLDDGELKDSIHKLAVSQNFPLTKLFVIDGSKRLSHSNAYFTGLPWSKQIVLFDTLINHSTVDETVAVLGHEIGHWKLLHLPKTLAAVQLHLFACFSMFSAFLHNRSLYLSFGFTAVQPTMIGFLLFNDIFQPFECVLQFGLNLLSRKHEFEADAFAQKCGYADDLAKALIKLLSENLSTMDADWLYSSYHHLHPILAERLSAIGYVSKEKVGNFKEEKKEE